MHKTERDEAHPASRQVANNIREIVHFMIPAPNICIRRLDFANAGSAPFNVMSVIVCVRWSVSCVNLAMSVGGVKLKAGGGMGLCE